MPGLNAVPVAEHAIALLLALARRLPGAADGFRPGHWDEPAGRSLAGTTVAVIGLGAIGTQIARRLAAFGITVIGIQRRASPAPPPAPGMRVTGSEHLHDVLGIADAVIIAASHRAGHPRVIATAHTAALTGGFFHDAAQRLGEAVHRWLHGLPPDNLLVPLSQVPHPELRHACLSTTATLNQAGVVTGMPTAPASRTSDFDISFSRRRARAGCGCGPER